jgi:diacylglycerol kinase (ATP)
MKGFVLTCNKKTMKSFTRSRLKSFTYAFEGLVCLLRSEKNMWIHLAATIIVILAGIYKHITSSDWCFIIIAIGLVWISEAFNTAMERLCNVVTKDLHPIIKQVKDISAAAVLIAAIIAILIGSFVFGS